MVSKMTTMQNKSGFHMRPASEFVNGLVGIKAKVYLKVEDKQIDAKSVMNLMAAAIKYGQAIEVIVDGEDEQVVLDKVVATLENMRD